jgi:hypothetical protein
MVHIQDPAARGPEIRRDIIAREISSISSLISAGPLDWRGWVGILGLNDTPLSPRSGFEASVWDDLFHLLGWVSYPAHRPFSIAYDPILTQFYLAWASVPSLMDS